MLLNFDVGEDSWESLGLQGDPTSSFQRSSVLGVHWKEWCWSWNSNTSATSCKELTHWKRLWCWEGLGQENGTTEDEMAGWHHGLDGRESEWTPGDGDGQGGLVCCNSCHRKESDTTEWLNWTELKTSLIIPFGHSSSISLNLLFSRKPWSPNQDSLQCHSLYCIFVFHDNCHTHNYLLTVCHFY